MKFYIPDVGSRLKITQDFLPELIWEHRNIEVILAVPSHGKRYDELYAADRYEDICDRSYPVLFRADTILSVQRVYIRKGASDYSSLTFHILESPDKHFSLKKHGGTWDSTGKRTFFLSLDEVHKMEFEPID